MSFEVEPPKYARVVATLRERIQDGQYAVGTMLPSEHQLVREFGVSRPTVVRALQILRQDGWIEPQQGRGTFVRGVPPSPRRVPHGRDLVERAESDEGRLVFAGTVEASVRIAGLLGIDSGSPVFLRRRVVTTEGEPCELVASYLLPALAEQVGFLEADALTEGARRRIETRGRVRLDRARELIGARLPTVEEAKLLRVDPAAPVLTLTVVVCDQDGRVVHVADAVFPGDRYELEDSYPLD